MRNVLRYVKLGHCVSNYVRQPYGRKSIMRCFFKSKPVLLGLTVVFDYVRSWWPAKQKSNQTATRGSEACFLTSPFEEMVFSAYQRSQASL